MFKKMLVLIVITMFFASCSLIKAPESEVVLEKNDLNLELGLEIVEDGELENEPEIVEEIFEEPVVVEKTGDELVSLNDSWNIYYNYDYKYSLHIPKKTNIWDCSGNTELSDVIVLKDGDISYPVAEYTYVDCEKIKNTEIPLERGYSWRIYSKQVNDLSGVEAFLKERYDLGCAVDSIDDNGNINILTSGPDDGCFLNYVTRAFYNEANGLVYSFNIGQDSNFMANDGGFDEEMANSFSFLK